MADTDHAQHAQASGGSCQLCPICLLLDGASTVSPEARAHLRAAGRELALALRATLDGLTREEPGPPPAEGLRRIDLEEP